MTALPDGAGLAPGRPRIISLDVMRGVVMVLMAIDHVRVYSGLPAGGPTPGIFFTRWITHFCAPAFVFLAGTAAYLHGRKLADRRALARYLAIRGFILVLLELTLIRAAWTFSLDYSEFSLAGVIWMLGWCMILLAALLRLPTRAIGGLGLIVIFGQNLVGLLAGATPESWRASWGWIWQVLYLGGEVKLGTDGPTTSVLYSLVPWIGVMAAGYGFGPVMTLDADRCRRLCLRIGLGATALFLAGALLTIALRPAPEGHPPLWYRMLDQNKYPASQLFLLMTLGPMIALLPLAERARGWFARVLETFGRVPMFYYLLHIPVIHAVALLVTRLHTGTLHPEWYAYAPYASVPEAHRWDLSLLYLVFVAVIALLFFPCRWYARLKARRPASWFRFI